jgi:predicted secreted protein
VHRHLCTDGKRNEASNFGAGSGGKHLWEGDGAAKVELTYSTTRNINRARPAFGTLVV